MKKLPTTRTFVLVPSFYKRLLTHYGKLECAYEYCRQPLEEGDEIVSKNTGGRVKHFHKRCFPKIYNEV